ncbi:MAG: riboflavin biosynthesis protein RibD [Maricaulis sp.]|jgi:diaminohydroxyphosphoribosylaminopyrimidine deaminase/5-amino-6-(5-phosphoribosylamino)uracil reductase|nr:riboflavin biosynthesis protein RibD [Maricaulis sp.]HAQ36776.1 riboflavin biosynthesis protein RibD [Alphaproteobacteria bacterium]
MTLPRVTLKLATSLDGRIALANGASQWITGPEARAEVHRLRAAHDAVLTGIGTVLADDPLLSARIEDEAPDQPHRVVLDTHLKIGADAKILNDADGGPVSVFCGGSVPVHMRAAIEAKGAQVIALNRFDGPSISFKSVIERLGETGSRSVMIEAGARLAGAAIRSGLVDVIEWFRAPMMLGGDARPVFDSFGLERLDEAPIFTRVAIDECGKDLWERYEKADG